MKNGENTPVAISFAPGGMCAMMGLEIQSIRPLGPGKMAKIMPAITKP
jgi:hypothetical protein